MTYFSAIPTPETEIGIAKEATRGTAVEPEFWLPIQDPKYKPDLMLLPDETLRGSMVGIYDEVPSLRYDSHGWDAYPYLDTFPVFVRACLGSKDTKVSAPTPGKLAKEAKAGEEEIELENEVAAGSFIVIGSGVGTQETVKVLEKAKKTKIAYPLQFTHANSTTCTGLTTHAFSLLNNADSEGNQPPSYTLTDFAGDKWRALAAAQLDGLNISGAADSLPKVTVSWFANASTEPSSPSPSYSTAESPPGWAFQVAIGGTQVGYLVTWEWDLKRNVKNVPAITGTQAYYQHFASVLDATAKITVLENTSATWLTAYEEGATETVDMILSDVKSGYAVEFHSTASKFTSGELDRSKEWVEVPLEIQCLPTSTDALAGGVSPIKITIANGTTTEY